MLALAGCVQPAMMPDINAAAARVLDRLGFSLLEAPGAGCCGAVRFHLHAQEGGRDDMRRNIDAWWPLVESGQVEAIVMTASGCGVTVREYGHYLRHDPAYAEKAARIGALTRDICEVVEVERARLSELLAGATGPAPKLAFHPPCTLQHGQKIRGVTESLLRQAGFELTPVTDSHLCCGSAGTYSLLQPELSTRLRDNKLTVLQAGRPQGIASSNIGCIGHLAGGTALPVRHWIEWLDRRLA
jgi:glycolate oxidase iron-sulfur subunit